MSIGRRLALGFGIVIGLLVMVAGTFIYGNQRQAYATDYLTSQIMPRADAAGDLETAYLLQSVGARSYILSGDERYLADYKKGVDQARDAISRLEKLPGTAEGTATLSEVTGLGVRFTQAADKAITLRQQGRVDEAQQSITSEMTPARDELLTQTEAFVALQNRLRDDTKVAIDSQQEADTRNSLIISFVALVVAGFLAYSSANAVRQPVRSLLAVGDRLAAGDYPSAIELSDRIAGDGLVSTGNEVRQLAARFHGVAQDLAAREAYLSAQSRLSGVLASTIETKDLAGEALREMAGYVRAQVGAVYARGDDEELHLVASYCLGETLPRIVRAGDGIVGEAAGSGRIVLVTDIPSDLPFTVRLGIDEVPPKWVAALPLFGHGELAGVAVLAGLQRLEKSALDYLELASRQLAVSLQNALGHERIQALADSLLESNEQLVAQAEEIQAQNEELQTQSEEIQTQNEELATQNDELEVRAEELAERNELLAQQAERISRLQAIAIRLSESLSPDEVLHQVVDAASELTGSAIASVFLLEESGERFTVAASAGLEEDSGRVGWLSREKSLAGRVLEERRTLFVEDASVHPEIQFPMLAGLKPVGSIVVAPMIVRGEAIGVVEVYYSEPRSFSVDEVEMMSALGASAAVAVYNSRLLKTATQQAQIAEAAVRVRDEFISVAAHELKTPVTSLKGFAQLVRRQLERNGGVDQDRLLISMQRIDQQSNRLTRLTEQLLSLSRLQSGKLDLVKEEIRISQLVHRTIADLQQVHPERVVSLREGGAVVASVDPLRVEQILRNLLDNAVKFSPEDAAIDVDVDDSEAGWVKISVRDRGIGIPEEKVGRVFERFYQAHPDRHYGGMGIGLFVSRQIAEAHGGTIAVERPEDGGSRFVVRIPLTPVDGESSS